MQRNNDSKLLSQLSKLSKEQSKIGRAFKSLAEWKIEDKNDESETIIDEIATAYLEDDGFYNLNWLDLFRRLQKLGAGQIILGRHGRKTRFSWKRGSSAYLFRGALEYPKIPEAPSPPPLAQSERMLRRGETGGAFNFGGINVNFAPTTTQSDVDSLLSLLSKFKNSRALKS